MPNPETTKTEEAPAPAGQPPVKQFSQEQVNELVGKARTETRAQFKDYDALKKENEGFKTNQLTESQKLTKDKEDADKRAINAETRAASLAINTEIKLKAKDKGFADVEDAVQLIDRSKIAVDGEDVKGVDEALDALLAKKPHLKAVEVKGRAIGANLNGKDGKEAPFLKVLTPEMKEAAHLMFRNLSPEKAEEAYREGLK